MKAIVYRSYGAADRLHLEELDKPTPRDDEVLIRVHAVSVNSWDWELLNGRPFVTRLQAPLKPRHPILGSDVAGVVTEVGKAVSDLEPGAEVFGDLSGGAWGGFAEYVCAPADRLALKPPRMSFEEAAAMPQAGLLALQGLRCCGSIKKGQRILINGGGGGVGTFAIQLARREGAEVIAVDSAEKLELMRTVGADHVVDYAAEDPTRPAAPYDLVLDTAMHRSIFAWARALKPGGTYRTVGGTTPRLLQLVALAPFVRLFQGKQMGLVILKQNREDLETLARLFEAGTVGPIIDRSYRLSETPEALARLGAGHTLGKVVITVRPEKAKAKGRAPRPTQPEAAPPAAM